LVLKITTVNPPLGLRRFFDELVYCGSAFGAVYVEAVWVVVPAADCSTFFWKDIAAASAMVRIFSWMPTPEKEPSQKPVHFDICLYIREI